MSRFGAATSAEPETGGKRLTLKYEELSREAYSDLAEARAAIELFGHLTIRCRPFSVTDWIFL